VAPYGAVQYFLEHAEMMKKEITKKLMNLLSDIVDGASGSLTTFSTHTIASSMLRLPVRFK
jgi:fluoride ion exporter CrcB/FEX